MEQEYCVYNEHDTLVYTVVLTNGGTGIDALKQTYHVVPELGDTPLFALPTEQAVEFEKLKLALQSSDHIYQVNSEFNHYVTEVRYVDSEEYPYSLTIGWSGLPPHYEDTFKTLADLTKELCMNFFQNPPFEWKAVED